RARHRRGGSSSRRLILGKDRGDIDRMTLQFLGKDEEAVIGHALRVENTIEMVAFVLHDPRMKPGHLALDRVAVEVEAAIAHAQMARHNPAQSRDRQATDRKSTRLNSSHRLLSRM